MQALIQDDKVYILATYDEKEIIKSMGDYKWNKTLKAWAFPIWKLPKLATYFNLNMSEDVLKSLKKQKQIVAERTKKIELSQQIKSGNNVLVPINNPELYDKLFTHQKQALVAAKLFDAYALFMETGTGKTLVAIRLIQLRKVPTLIVCPLSVIEGVWIPELDKWSPELKKCNLWKLMRVKNAHIPESTDVCVINFESFKKLKDPESHFKLIIIDESSKLKCNKTQITKKFISIRDKIPFRLILSGLPAPNNLLEYWGQMAFVNDRLLGSNFYAFRNKYFKSVGVGGFQYVPKRDAKEDIMAKINEQAYYVSKADCLDLPDQLFEKRIVEMTAPQRKAYDDMWKQNIMEYKGHTALAMNELSKIMKVREITSGFIISEAGMPVFISDTKMKILKAVVEEEIPKEKQIIIWAQFHFEIEAMLDLFGDDAVALYGGVKSQLVKDENIRLFKEKKKRIIIAHPLTGSKGLTFVNSSYQIWFSISYSQEDHKQGMDRIHRIGQIEKCTYIYLLAKDSIDEIIYDVLLKKQNLADVCLAMLKGV